MENNLKKIRQKKGITQQQLAEMTKTSISQIQKIENNKSIPTIYIVLKIKKALDVKNVEELFKL